MHYKYLHMSYNFLLILPKGFKGVLHGIFITYFLLIFPKGFGGVLYENFFPFFPKGLGEFYIRVSPHFLPNRVWRSFYPRFSSYFSHGILEEVPIYDSRDNEYKDQIDQGGVLRDAQRGDQSDLPSVLQ